ncbi:MAG: TPR end-of-group domain-containing protein [Candidatus Helarchaeota archaeon]
MEVEQGNVTAVLACLENVLELYPEELEFIETAPAFAPLRDDPRFQSMLAKYKRDELVSKSYNR